MMKSFVIKWRCEDEFSLNWSNFSVPKSIDEGINEEEDNSLLYNDIDVLRDSDTMLENSKQCNYQKTTSFEYFIRFFPEVYSQTNIVCVTFTHFYVFTYIYIIFWLSVSFVIFPNKLSI